MIAQQDFIITYKQQLNASDQNVQENNLNLITQISIKKNEDIDRAIQTLFEQEGINPSLLTNQSQMAQELNMIMSQQPNISDSIITKEKIQSQKARWKELLNQINENNQKSKNDKIIIEKTNFIKKFVKLCCITDDFQQINEFLLKTIKQDSQIQQSFLERKQDLQKNLNSTIQKFEKQKKQNNTKEIDEEIQKSKDEISEKIKQIQLEFLQSIKQNQTMFKTELNQLIVQLYQRISEKRNQSTDNNDNNYIEKQKNNHNNVNNNSYSNPTKNLKTTQKKNWQLCLGSQKKFQFHIKLQQKDLGEVLQNQKYYQKQKANPNPFFNLIYGINNKAMLTIYNSKKQIYYLQEEIYNQLKTCSELFFDTFDEQIKKIKHNSNQQIQQQASQNQDQIKVYITQHSNLGKIRYLFNVDLYTGPDSHIQNQQQLLSQQQKQPQQSPQQKGATISQEIGLNLMCDQLNEIFVCANNQGINCIVIHIDQFLKGIKKEEFKDYFKKLGGKIKHCLAKMAVENLQKNFLKKINIYYSNQLYEYSDMIDVFNSVFE